MGSQEDDDYWNTKYAESSCHTHGETTYYDAESGEWECYECIDEEDMQNG